jgi:hypothetical protein
MATIALISCVSQKLPYAAPAGELYTSTLFTLNLQYAKLRQPDAIYVLSAKYGLLPLDRVIEPYDLTLNTMSARQAREWAQKVFAQLSAATDVESDHFIWLAGMKYRQHLIDRLPSSEVPLEGLTIGRQLQRLQQEIAEMERA